jgi:ribosomal protein S18 acetylase RimI-like enzyme
MYKILEITSTADIKQFVRFAGSHIFKKSDPWVPPLISEEVKRFDIAKYDYYTYGTSKLFAAIDEKGIWVGRIACFINSQYIDKTKKREGFFGFFDAIDSPEVIKILFSAITDEFSKNNITDIVGPINFSTNEEVGLLVDGFEINPTFMTNYSKPYYNELLTGAGFQKMVDLYAYEWHSKYVFPDQFYRIVRAVKNRSKVKMRCFDKNNFQNEIDTLWPIYNESFKDVWGFTPLTKVEFDELCNSFKLFADFDMILIAELNSEVIGFCLALPDINILIKKIDGKLFPLGIFTLLAQKNKIKNLRLNVLAIKPEFRNLGVVPLLIDQLVKVANKKGYQKAELSVVLEPNVEMTRLMKTLNFKPTKTFRVYCNTVNNLKAQTL